MTLRRVTSMMLGGRTGAFVALANAVVNYGAVAFSSSLNVYFMRNSEIVQGISVLDPETLEEVGTSKKAAAMGIQ
jgi:hypothetical protein